MFPWVNEFEKKFNIKVNYADNVVRIIIGEAPYKQKLNGIDFKVFSKKNPFRDFRYIAFLVKDWIKVQDSLEMIFNMLFNSHSKGLEAISYLRKHKVSAEEFGIYLYKRHSILLVNRYLDSKTVTNKFVGINDRNKYILDFISNIRKRGHDVYVLFVGKESKKKLDLKGVESGEAVHPSGSNLNKPKLVQKYYGVWYRFNDKDLTKATKNFSLKHFTIV
ncbi:hypothetical protein [Desulfosporosinus nitroreducens]|uniref:hypothetical protein n=1 Tax=Desulfosporosinus nitroreducens TaxID=2018668 RepID=UPI00207D222F|nr:hypothetical protein [Desulfosporosinus nitroreducens]MCO1604613.1 hypothetical protein [Desulfosporosinus nitroreducens]